MGCIQTMFFCHLASRDSHFGFFIVALPFDFFFWYSIFTYFHWHIGTTSTTKKNESFQCDTVWYSYWNMFFSYRFYTSHIPYLWCKRIYTSCRRLCNLKNEIYDIGTKILYFQCFVTTDMFLFCKSICFSGMSRIFRDLAFGSIKTRFKGFWDIFFEKLHATLDSQVAGTVFIGLLPLEGD